MHTLIIGAASVESARGFFDCLQGFQAELIETADSRYEVRITMDGARDMLGRLAAIDRHIAERADGPARIDFDGRRYLIESAPRE